MEKKTQGKKEESQNLGKKKRKSVNKGTHMPEKPIKWVSDSITIPKEIY